MLLVEYHFHCHLIGCILWYRERKELALSLSSFFSTYFLNVSMLGVSVCHSSTNGLFLAITYLFLRAKKLIFVSSLFLIFSRTLLYTNLLVPIHLLI